MPEIGALIAHTCTLTLIRAHARTYICTHTHTHMHLLPPHFNDERVCADVVQELCGDWLDAEVVLKLELWVGGA